MERLVLARSLAWSQRAMIALVWVAAASWLVIASQGYQPTAPLVVDLRLAWFGGLLVAPIIDAVIVTAVVASRPAGVERVVDRLPAPPPDPEPNRRLVAAFGFSYDDLVANRQGQLSEAQIAFARRAITTWRLSTAIVVLVFLATPVFLGIMAVASGARPADLIVGLPVVLLVIAVVIGWTVISYRRLAWAASRRHADVTEGEPTWWPQDRVRIGSIWFRPGTPDRLDAFLPGVGYRVYYLPSGPAPIVLSAEVVGQEPTSDAHSAAGAAGRAERVINPDHPLAPGQRAAHGLSENSPAMRRSGGWGLKPRLWAPAGAAKPACAGWARATPDAYPRYRQNFRKTKSRDLEADAENPTGACWEP